MICLKHLDTKNLPLTYSLLKKNLPSILNSECFNNGNLPFSVEVKKTQLGHLFEHIMLEYICDLKIKGGAKKIIVSGRTIWNWKKADIGTYNIIINVGSKDYDIFLNAFEQSLSLFELIINQNHKKNGQTNSIRFSRPFLKNSSHLPLRNHQFR